MKTTAEEAGSSGAPGAERRGRALSIKRVCSRIAMAAAACFCISCTSMLPMTDDIKSSMSEEDVKRRVATTHLSEADVRDPKIHEVHEVKLSCWQMMQQCYPSVPF